MTQPSEKRQPLRDIIVEFHKRAFGEEMARVNFRLCVDRISFTWSPCAFVRKKSSMDLAGAPCHCPRSRSERDRSPLTSGGRRSGGWAFSGSPLFGGAAADGDRPRSGGSVEMRPARLAAQLAILRGSRACLRPHRRCNKRIRQRLGSVPSGVWGAAPSHHTLKRAHPTGYRSGHAFGVPALAGRGRGSIPDHCEADQPPPMAALINSRSSGRRSTARNLGNCALTFSGA